jgi:hypothetical protein
MSDLTAIDILVNPDEATIQRAREVNARMLKSMPEGWVLDATHQPHITTLQRYVRTADLAKVHEAVGKALAETDMASLSYQAVKIAHADWGFPGYGPRSSKPSLSTRSPCTPQEWPSTTSATTAPPANCSRHGQ